MEMVKAKTTGYSYRGSASDKDTINTCDMPKYLGLKTFKYYYETDELPNPWLYNPTQEKKG